MIKYIDIVAKMTQDGIPKPIQILWETGKTYDIDKIIDIKKKASTKGGGAGLMYKVKVLGKEKILFLKDNKWFIELD